jgi:predicted dehydrogenase
MTERRLGIIMNGVTGRMGMNQHLARSIAAIRASGGLTLRDGEQLLPDPILVGRNKAKLKALAAEYAIAHYTTDLDAALSDGYYQVFFDAS